MIFIKDGFINDDGEIIILVIIWKLLYLIIEFEVWWATVQPGLN